MIAALTGGQAGDNPMLATLVKALAEGGYDQDFRLLADKAYSHPSTRIFLRGRKIGQVPGGGVALWSFGGGCQAVSAGR